MIILQFDDFKCNQNKHVKHEIVFPEQWMQSKLLSKTHDILFSVVVVLSRYDYWSCSFFLCWSKTRRSCLLMWSKLNLSFYLLCTFLFLNLSNFFKLSITILFFQSISLYCWSPRQKKQKQKNCWPPKV